MEVVPEQSFDLESIIDLLEEKFSAEALKYPTDFSSCRVTHPQLPLQIHFEIKVLTLTAPIAAGPERFTQAFGVLRGSW